MTKKTTGDEKTLVAIRAKVAAKKRWHALQPQGEAASPVCYLDEVPAVPDLETFMNLAAMEVLSGLSSWQLERLKVDRPHGYRELLEKAQAVPYTHPGIEEGNLSS